MKIKIRGNRKTATAAEAIADLVLAERALGLDPEMPEAVAWRSNLQAEWAAHDELLSVEFMWRLGKATREQLLEAETAVRNALARVSEAAARLQFVAGGS